MKDERVSGTNSRCDDHSPTRSSRSSGSSGVILPAILVSGLLGAVAATLVAPPRPRIIWNVTASAPLGPYVVEIRSRPAVGEMVAARVPALWRGLAGARRYLPVNVPLIKRVAAASGDRVCAIGDDIEVNGQRVAGRRARDGAGRPMPSWSGCVTLRRDQYFLLMDNRSSFDGRYFGPTGDSDIIGKVRPLWAR